MGVWVIVSGKGEKFLPDDVASIPELHLLFIKMGLVSRCWFFSSPELWHKKTHFDKNAKTGLHAVSLVIRLTFIFAIGLSSGIRYSSGQPSLPQGFDQKFSGSFNACPWIISV